MSTPLIVAKGICKVYKRGDEEVHALRDVDVEIERGSYVSIIGPSGSGKSTLFNIVGGIDLPTSGDISVDGRRLTDLSSSQLAWFRCHRIGFIFQSFNLIETMTALENVAIAAIFAGKSPDEANRVAKEVLEKVGLGHRLTHLPSRVSGGQRQRIAIARALANKPLIILADEPTGNLDLRTGQEIIDLLFQMKAELGITIVTATHDMKMLSRSDTIIRIENGSVAEVSSSDQFQVTIGTIDGSSVL
jgi:putative ABC transport system ATP-binding protein